MRDRNTGWQPKTYTPNTHTPNVYPKISSLQDAYNFSRRPIVITHDDGNGGITLIDVVSKLPRSNPGVPGAIWTDPNAIVGGDGSVDDPFWSDGKVLLMGGTR